MSGALVVYFSYSHGNTKKIAEKLASALGADIEPLLPLVPYEGTMDEVVAEGEREVNAKKSRPIKPLGLDPADYDLIAIGTPTWWYTMAPCVKSFFERYSLKGKTVVPFTTNGGWPGHAIKDMNDLSLGAKVVCPMQIRFDSGGGSRQITPEKDVEAWIEGVVFLAKR